MFLLVHRSIWYAFLTFVERLLVLIPRFQNLYNLAQRELAETLLPDAHSLSLNRDILRPGAAHGIVQCHQYRERLYEVRSHHRKKLKS